MVLIFIQTLAEELVFRGYLLQQLRARFRSIWIWAVLPSFLFGALHFDPLTYGVNAYFYVLNTTVAGVLACLITIRTGNLGAAAGLHFANNMLVMIMGVAGELGGFTLLAMTVNPMSGYMTWSILSQTGLSLVIFALWWRWMNRQHAIANAPGGD
nr:CPBP family intramembrane glutamic endopeptidase [Aliiroseovarius subalbicans]